MSSTIDTNSLPAIDALRTFLDRLCRNNGSDGWVNQLAQSKARWSAVQDSLSAADRQELHRIAFQSRVGGFSSGNLKAHYVLDEDFIDDGTAFVLFALVGSDWTYVVRVNGQNRFTPASTWLAGYF